tara:strand:+ start:295 stop:1464 length:1170 start_codon:yes stop_codon:yes gene_type:complete
MVVCYSFIRIYFNDFYINELMGIFDFFKTNKEEETPLDDKTLLRDDRYIKIYNSCYDLLWLQIELSITYLKKQDKIHNIKNKDDDYLVGLNNDWVVGYVMGFVMSILDNSYLKGKNKIYMATMCGVLHEIGIRNSTSLRDHEETVNNFWVEGVKNKDTDYYKGSRVGFDECERFLKKEIELEQCLELSHYLNSIGTKDLVEQKVDKKQKELLTTISNFYSKKQKELDKRREDLSSKKSSKEDKIESIIWICSNSIELQFLVSKVQIQWEKKNSKTQTKDTDWVAGYIFGVCDCFFQMSTIKHDKEAFKEVYRTLLFKFKIFNKSKKTEYDSFINETLKSKVKLSNKSEFDEGMMIGGQDMTEWFQQKIEHTLKLANYIQDVILKKTLNK